MPQAPTPFTNLTPGLYEVQIAASGFRTVTSALSNSGSVEGGERAIRFAIRFSF